MSSGVSYGRTTAVLQSPWPDSCAQAGLGVFRDAGWTMAHGEKGREEHPERGCELG